MDLLHWIILASYIMFVMSPLIRSPAQFAVLLGVGIMSTLLGFVRWVVL